MIRNKKMLFVIVLFVYTSITSMVGTAAESNDKMEVDTKSIQKEVAEYKIKMSIPILKGLKDQSYQKQLNDQMMKYALTEKEKFLKQAKEMAELFKKQGMDIRQSELLMAYKVKQTGKFVSILMDTYTYTGGAHGNEEVAYYNFINDKQAHALQLKDLFKDDAKYQATINHFIKEKIKQAPGMFFEGEMGFQTIHEDQNFYIDQDDLVIAFEKYEIAAGAAGIPKFRIPLADLKLMMKPSIVKALGLK